jgi:DNA-binding transcriptional regulator YhcF (GntR family)
MTTKEILRGNHKTECMIQYLERDILSGRLKAGDKIPSLRDLMELFSLSKGTVARGLDSLCERGFLEKHIGSGTFVRKNRSLANNSNKQAITIFCPHDIDTLSRGATMFSQILMGIKDAAKIKNRDLSVIRGLGDNALRILPEQLDYANENSPGVIFIGEYDTFHRELDLRIPAVGVFMQNSYDNRLSIINLDAWDAALKACEHFKKHRQQHVVIVSNAQPVFANRARVFDYLWKSMGGTSEIKVIDEKTATLPGKDAYFFASDSIAQNTMINTFDLSGIKIHESCCVCGVEGKRLLDPNFYAFPTYAVDWHYMGKYVFEEINYRIENLGAPARRIDVSGHFIDT